MYLRSLKLSNFRSCYDTTVTFQPTLTLLVGENNSGKSNVIEALRLATARSTCAGRGTSRPTTGHGDGTAKPSNSTSNWTA
ncbi:MAG: AAA family ATPase [Trebonia sp.]